MNYRNRLRQVNYKTARKLMRSGDVLMFSGTGLVSAGIRFFTRSNVSHAEVVLRTRPLDSGQGLPGNIVQVIGSTTLRKKTVGVQINRLSAILEAYEGRVWLLRLSEDVRRNMDVPAFIEFMLSQRMKRYDFRQVIRFLIPFGEQKRSMDRMYCSELVAYGLQHCGVLPKRVNPSAVTPIDLARLRIYDPLYFQLKGTRQEIKGFNSEDVF